MDHSGREDRKLSEVKAVLRRLQGLPAEPETAGSSSAAASARISRRIAGAVGIAAAAVVLVVAYAFPRPKDAPTSAAVKDPPAAGPGGPSTVQTTALTGRAPSDDPLTVVPKGRSLSSTPLKASAPADKAGPGATETEGARPGSLPRGTDGAKAPVVRPALQAALALMNSGRVQLARQRLLAMAADGPPDVAPDVAWALARSYDPNSLKAIPGADAAPDIDEAARWYRTWYAAAVKQGMVADSVSLERIIGSMQR